METLRVLVTGGVGFIGSHLIRVLVRAGHQVRVLDNLSTGSVENLADVLDAIEFVRVMLGITGLLNMPLGVLMPWFTWRLS